MKSKPRPLLLRCEWVLLTEKFPKTSKCIVNVTPASFFSPDLWNQWYLNCHKVRNSSISIRRDYSNITSDHIGLTPFKSCFDLSLQQLLQPLQHHLKPGVISDVFFLLLVISNNTIRVPLWNLCCLAELWILDRGALAGNFMYEVAYLVYGSSGSLVSRVSRGTWRIRDRSFPTPAKITSTLACLLITKTPRLVLLRPFLMHIASIRVEWGSLSSVYGRPCRVLNEVLALGESLDRPYME